MLDALRSICQISVYETVAIKREHLLSIYTDLSEDSKAESD